jgi:nucleotide-binding universal stress UspA family protein
MRSILVTASGGDGDGTVFATALRAARPLGAHLEFFHLRVHWGEAARNTPHVDFARGAALRHALQDLEAEREARSVAARRHFEAFCAQPGIPIAMAPGEYGGVSASLLEETGESASQLARLARHNDMVVLGRHTCADGLPADFIDKVLFRSGRPILVAPTRSPKTLTGTVMVCWKETPESARALRAAMPLLTKANRVVIANVPEPADESVDSANDVARHLAWHGIDAEVRRVARNGRPAGELLSAAARDCGADLLVMGAYGHSRMRQLLFGGCTQYFLSDAAHAVLFTH